MKSVIHTQGCDAADIRLFEERPIPTPDPDELRGGDAAPKLENATVPSRPRDLFVLLSLANFTVGFGAFVIVAVLPLLAADLGVTATTAGWALTAYAAAYAVGSPIGVALTGRFDRRTVLAGGLAIFGMGALMSAIAPSFAIVVLARAIMALGGGVVTPVAASVAIGQVPVIERGRALAYVFAGLTLAQAIGVPAGAWLGYTLGWRETFLVAALLAVLSSLLLRLRLPAHLFVPVTTLRELGQTLRRPDLAMALLFTVLFMGGVWTLYTFFVPLLETRLDIGGHGIAAIMFVFGMGAVLGNALGGQLTDRIGPARTLFLLALAQMVLMPVLSLAPFAGVASAAAAVLLWSLAGWSFMVPQQARLATLDPNLAPMLFALNAAAIYIAVSVGSVTGGAFLADVGLGALGPVGASFVFLALLSIPIAERLARWQRTSSDEDRTRSAKR